MSTATRGLVVTLLTLALAGCSTPSPSSSTPTATAASEATLTLQGRVGSWCGAIGGCAYSAQVRWPHGIQGAYEFESGRDGLLMHPAGLSHSLPAGQYEVVMDSRFVSDVIMNGQREFGPVDAWCSRDLTVAEGQTSVVVDVVFNAGSCEISISGE